MRRTTIGLLLCFIALGCRAAQSPEGRWEGLIRIPGGDQPVVVDLSPAGAGGWTGSIILSRLGIKGAPLSNIVVTDADVAFDMGTALADAQAGPARFSARRVAAEAMTGEMRQAGNVASLSLARIGPAQVEAPPRSTPVGRDIERPVERRVRARRLSPARDDHARESRERRGDSHVRDRRQADERPAGRSRDPGRRHAAARIAGESGDFRGARACARAARSRGRSSSDRSKCPWCCAAPAGGRDEERDLRRRAGEPARRRQRIGAIDVPRRLDSRGRVSRPGAARVSSRQMEVPDRRPDRLVAGLHGRHDLLRRRRRQRLRGVGGRRPAALEARDRRSGSGDARRRGRVAVRGQLRRQVLCARRTHRRNALEVRDRGRAAVRGEGSARNPAEEPDDRRPVRRLSVEPRARGRRSLLRQRRRQRLRARCGDRRLEMEIQDRRRRSRLTRVRGRRRLLRKLGQLFLRGRREDRRGAMAVPRRRGSADPQPGRIPVVARGRRRRRLHRLPGFEPLCDRCGDRARKVALQQRRELGDRARPRSRRAR